MSDPQPRADFGGKQYLIKKLEGYRAACAGVPRAANCYTPLEQGWFDGWDLAQRDKPVAPTTQTYTFDQWLSELDKIARINGGKGSMVEPSGKECWLEYFACGSSPADAYLEDLSYA